MPVLLAAILAAAQPAPPPPSRPRPVACVVDRLDHAYLSGLWLRMNDGGIPTGDAAAERLRAAVQACSEQWNWRERDRTYALYYALAWGHHQIVMAQRVPREEDQARLRRAMFAFAPARLDILERDAEGAPLGSGAKPEFRAFLEQTDPELLRRLDYETLWAAAQPLLIAQIMNAHFALGAIMP
jgi:hypothetical protein